MGQVQGDAAGLAGLGPWLTGDQYRVQSSNVSVADICDAAASLCLCASLQPSFLRRGPVAMVRCAVRDAAVRQQQCATRLTRLLSHELPAPRHECSYRKNVAYSIYPRCRSKFCERV